MQTLREQPVVSLVDARRMDTFIADVFQPRPTFDDIVKFSDQWSAKVAEKIQLAMERKNCPVKWVQFVVDQNGFLMIMHFDKPLVLGNVKNAAKVILRCLPDQQAPGLALAVEKDLRPLDEFDRNRIAAWQTVASLRPKGQKRKREPDDSDEGECQLLAKRAKTVAEFLAEESSSEEEVEPPRLMLTNGSAAQDQTLAVPSILDPAAVWEHRAKSEAVIVVAEVGQPPQQLAYLRCHHESRRQLLLQSKIKEEYESPGMLQVVRVAMQLVKDGSMPGPGEHGRKSEFIRRCATALKALDPSKETDLKKLDPQAQQLIRQVLGGDVSTPYDGCLNEDCLDKKTIWKTEIRKGNSELPEETLSRCAHCGHLKSYGRNFKSLRDLLQKELEREKGRPLRLEGL